MKNNYTVQLLKGKKKFNKKNYERERSLATILFVTSKTITINQDGKIRSGSNNPDLTKFSSCSHRIPNN
jgi:hypothetical protein